jgi:hypothetical protein
MLKIAGANTTRLTMSERVKTIIEMVRPIIQGMDKEEKLELKKKLGINSSQSQINHIEGVEVSGNFHFNPRQENGNPRKPKVEIVINKDLSNNHLAGRCYSLFYEKDFECRFQNLCSDLGCTEVSYTGRNWFWLGYNLPPLELDPLFDKIEHHFPNTDWDLDFSIVGEER